MKATGNGVETGYRQVYSEGLMCRIWAGEHLSMLCHGCLVSYPSIT